MKINIFIRVSLLILGFITLLFPLFSQAQATNNLWKYASNIVQPVLSTWSVKSIFFTATSISTASTFPYASTTALSSGTLCFTADTCRTTWPTGGSGGSLALQAITGTIDGSNKTFTFVSAVSGKSIIDLNGQLLIEDVDFTISGTTVTYVTAPPSNPSGSDTHKIISGGGAVASVTSVSNEIVPGSNTTFTLANTPTVGTVRVFALGQRLVPTTDYTISGAVITTVSTWTAGSLLADYTY